MPPSSPPFLDPAWLAVLLVLGTAVCWYLAVTTAVRLVPDRGSALIFGGALPALAGAIWFTAIGRAGAAMALVLGTAMAACTLVAGIITNAEPEEGRRVWEDPARRLQATLLPVAVVLLVAGFNGRLTLLHAALLLAAGAIVIWLAAALRSEIPTAALAASPQASDESAPWMRWTHLALAVALAVIGAGLASGAAQAAGRRRGELLDFELAMLVAWLLALPLIGAGTRFASAGQGPAAQRGLMLLAVYLVCFGLPVVVLIDAARQAFAAFDTAGWGGILSNPPSVAMPLRLWRGDSVMLSIAGLLVFPAALGRWRLGRLEGGVLIALYAIYVVVALLSRR